MQYSKQLPDAKIYDVVVCGCGVAGFVAAVQAGRLGVSVCLIEDTGMPGACAFGVTMRQPFCAGSKRLSGYRLGICAALVQGGICPYTANGQAFIIPYRVFIEPIPMAHLMDEVFWKPVDIYIIRIVDSIVKTTPLLVVVSQAGD